MGNAALFLFLVFASIGVMNVSSVAALFVGACDSLNPSCVLSNAYVRPFPLVYATDLLHIRVCARDANVEAENLSVDFNI